MIVLKKKHSVTAPTITECKSGHVVMSTSLFRHNNMPLRKIQLPNCTNQKTDKILQLMCMSGKGME